MTDIEILSERMSNLENRFTNLNIAFEVIKRFTPYVYTQRRNQETTPGLFQINLPADRIKPESIFYMLPCERSVNSENILSIVDSSNLEKSYRILYEAPTGTLEPIDAGSIIPNRLAMFRFAPSDNYSVILLNNPLHGTIVVDNLTVLGNTIFTNRPVYKDEEGSEHQIAFKSDVDEVSETVENLNDVFYGSETPEIALADSEEGTIYIQV